MAISDYKFITVKISFLMIAAEPFKSRNFVSLQKIQILCREVKSNNNNNKNEKN